MFPFPSFVPAEAEHVLLGTPAEPEHVVLGPGSGAPAEPEHVVRGVPAEPQHVIRRSAPLAESQHVI